MPVKVPREVLGVKIPKEVRTDIEKWAVPLAAGGLVGFAAYKLAAENPAIWGIAFGIVAAFLVGR